MLKYTLIFAFFITTFLQGCAKRGDPMPLLSGDKPPKVSQAPSAPSDDSAPSSDSSKSSTYCEKITLSEIGYEEDIIPIVEKYCKFCHQTGAKNWMNYEAFATAKDAIYNRVFNTKDMPLGMPRPNDEELNLLKQWLESGVPQKGGKQSEIIPCPTENNPSSNSI